MSPKSKVKIGNKSYSEETLGKNKLSHKNKTQ